MGRLAAYVSWCLEYKSKSDELAALQEAEMRWVKERGELKIACIEAANALEAAEACNEEDELAWKEVARKWAEERRGLLAIAESEKRRADAYKERMPEEVLIARLAGTPALVLLDKDDFASANLRRHYPGLFQYVAEHFQIEYRVGSYRVLRKKPW